MATADSANARVIMTQAIHGERFIVKYIPQIKATMGIIMMMHKQSIRYNTDILQADN
jgi:hypothetical protein